MHRVMTATNALYVRLPHPEFDKLDRAAAALSTNKKAIVTTLVSRYVDPDSAHGLDHLRATLNAGSPEATGAPSMPTGAHPLDAPAGPGAPSRRVTINLPDEGMAIGHHAFTPAPPLDVLTPAQAAELLQVPEPELLALAEVGSLPGRRIGEHWRFSRAALIEWLAS
jgi:excisionase family DNA binding protein